MANGLNADIKNMTQAEKTMLRYQYVMVNSAKAQGDFVRTSNTWHNQIVILKQQLQQLAVVIGSGLIQAIKPFVQQVNIALSGLISFAQKVVNALGKIFGWEMEINPKGLAINDDALEDGADAMGSLGDAADNAAKSTKELNKQLQGFDKLNVLTTQKDKKKKDDSKAVNPDMAISNNDGDIAAGLKKTKGVFESEIDNLFDLGRYINKKLTDALNSIKWDAVYQKAREWAAGLAHFLNGLISPEMFAAIGRTLVNGLNTAFHFLDEFAKEFDWGNLGRSIGAGLNAFFGGFDWSTILSAAKRWGQGIATTINEAVRTTDFYQIGKTVMKMLETALTFAFELGNGIDFVQLGNKLADGINGAIKNFPAKKFADTIDVWVQGLWDLLVSTVSGIDGNALGDKIRELVSNIDPKTWKILIGGLLLLKGVSFTVSIGGAIISAVANEFIKGLAHQLFLKMGGSTLLKGAIGEGLGKAAGGATLGQATAEGAGFAGLFKFLGGIGALLGGATLAVTQFFSQWKNGWTVLSEILKWIGIALAAVGAVILGAPALVAAAVAGIIGLVTSFVILLKENWGTITKGFANTWNQLKTSTVNAFKEAGQKAKAAFDDMKNGIIERANSIKANVVNKFTALKILSSAVWNAMKTFASNTWNNIKSTAINIFNSLKTNVGNIFNSLKTNVGNIWNNIKTEAGNKWNALKDGIGSIASSIKDRVGSAFSTLKTNAGNIFSGLYDSAKNIFGKVKSAMTNPVESAKNAIGKIINKVKSLFDFDWNFPRPKMPHFRYHWKDIGGVLRIPVFDSIEWYKKAYNNPYLFGSSTILPTSSGWKGFGDGNGGEIVYGHANLMDDIREASGGSQMSAIGNRQLANDQRIIQLLTIIAEKEFGISQDAVFRAVRNGASDYTMRTGRGAFEF